MSENQDERKDDYSLLLQGALGIAIIPDDATQKRSRSLAAELLAGKAEYFLTESDLPHLTLYHGKILDLPIKDAAEVVKVISGKLKGAEFELASLGIVGDNFLFWDVDWASDTHGLLRECHDTALGLAKYLNRNEPANAAEEGLKLSDQELANIKDYGHPLVAEFFRPHITLGFHKGFEDAVQLSIDMLRWPFSVERVELVRVGFPGRVEGVVEL